MYLTNFHTVTVDFYIVFLRKILVTADGMGFCNVAEVDLTELLSQRHPIMFYIFSVLWLIILQQYHYWHTTQKCYQEKEKAQHSHHAEEGIEAVPEDLEGVINFFLVWEAIAVNSLDRFFLVVVALNSMPVDAINRAKPVYYIP